jgi:hypothetical protein
MKYLILIVLTPVLSAIFASIQLATLNNPYSSSTLEFAGFEIGRSIGFPILFSRNLMEVGICAGVILLIMLIYDATKSPKQSNNQSIKSSTKNKTVHVAHSDEELLELISTGKASDITWYKTPQKSSETPSEIPTNDKHYYESDDKYKPTFSETNNRVNEYGGVNTVSKRYHVRGTKH